MITPRYAILSTLAFVLPLVAADALFVGCYSITPSGTSAVANQNSATACSTACYSAATTNTHSYYNASSSACFCSAGTPNQAYLQTGNADSCGTNFDNRDTKTSFMQWSTPCYDTMPGGITAISGYNPTGANGCLKKCASYTMATFWGNTAANLYYCACGVPTSYGNAVTCGPQTYFEFYHTQAAASQGLSRRKRMVEEEAKQAKKLFCPRGFNACLVESGDKESYECIDTSSELESCGGCLLGQYDTPNATIGEDCTTMNAAMGGATCANGKCVAYACKRGYRLVNGKCAR